MNTIEPLKQMENYKDADGLVAPGKTSEGQRNASGNGVAYSAFYGMVLSSLPMYLSLECVTADELDEQHRLLDHELTAASDAIARCRVPGQGFMLHRSPVPHNDQQAWDDYLAALCYFTMTRSPYLKPLALEIQKRRWPLGISYYMNNEQFLPGRPGATKYHHPDGRINIEAWIGRFPLVRYMTNLALSNWIACAFYSVAWAVTVIQSSKKPYTEQDSWRTLWMVVEAYLSRRKSIPWYAGKAITDYAVRFYREKFLAIPGGITATQAGYFESDHPMIKLWEIAETERHEDIVPPIMLV